MKQISFVTYGIPVSLGAGAMPVAFFNQGRHELKTVQENRKLAFDLSVLDTGCFDIKNGLCPLDPEFPRCPFAYFLGKSHIDFLEKFQLIDTLKLLPFTAEWGRYAPVFSPEGVQELRQRLLQDIFETDVFTNESQWTPELSLCLLSINHKSEEAWMVYILTADSKHRDVCLRSAVESLEIPIENVVGRILSLFPAAAQNLAISKAISELKGILTSLSR